MIKDIHIMDTRGNVLVAGQWVNGKIILKPYVTDVNSRWIYYDDRYYKKPTEKKIMQKFMYTCKRVENID